MMIWFSSDKDFLAVLKKVSRVALRSWWQEGIKSACLIRARWEKSCLVWEQYHVASSEGY
jgi:hypothetical protein